MEPSKWSLHKAYTLHCQRLSILLLMFLKHVVNFTLLFVFTIVFFDFCMHTEGFHEPVPCDAFINTPWQRAFIIKCSPTIIVLGCFGRANSKRCLLLQCGIRTQRISQPQPPGLRRRQANIRQKTQSPSRSRTGSKRLSIRAAPPPMKLVGFV